MELGTFMEFHSRNGVSQEDAFKESFHHVDLAEELGLDGIWLAESHFAPSRAVLSAPLIMAAAIAGRTKRIKIGTAVHVLPLGNPLHIAEQVATLDHISNGRFEFGVGRSGSPASYEGYNISYAESRERFYESLDIISAAFKHDVFSYDGKFFKFTDVCLTPKPLQNPYPPMRVAAPTSDTFPVLGNKGAPIFVGVRNLPLKDVTDQVRTYRQAFEESGNDPINNKVALRVPVHVAESTKTALENSEESFMRQFKRLGKQLESSAKKATADSSEDRVNRSNLLANTQWNEIQGEKVAVGDPDTVIHQLKHMSAELGLDGIIAEFNAGELIPPKNVEKSIKLFCEEVIPELKK